MTTLGDTMTTDETMRVWVGCLACYNEGRLVGEWVDAIDAAEFMPCERPSHEEFWCMDTDNMPVSGELSPSEATRIAEILGRITAPADAVGAYVSNFGAEWDDDLPDAFEGAYNGEWDSEKDFAQDLAEQLDAIPADYSWPASYIDWDAATRDLFSGDYWSDTIHGVTYVFRNL